MGFWDDDFLPIAGMVGGGLGGFMLGGPGGALAGAGLGGKLGSGLGGLFGGSDEGADQSKAIIDLWNKLGGQLPTYQGPMPGQGLTPIERAGFNRAQMEAGGVAKGREGAIGQDVMRSTGGVASAGGLAAAKMIGNQGAMNRLSQNDQDVAGRSVERDIMSERALNDFNQRNMATRLGIAGGQTGALENEMNRQQYSGAAQAGKASNLFQGVGDMGMNIYNNKNLMDWLNKQGKQPRPYNGAGTYGSGGGGGYGNYDTPEGGP